MTISKQTCFFVQSTAAACVSFNLQLVFVRLGTVSIHLNNWIASTFLNFFRFIFLCVFHELSRWHLKTTRRDFYIKVEIRETLLFICPHFKRILIWSMSFIGNFTASILWSEYEKEWHSLDSTPGTDWFQSIASSSVPSNGCTRCRCINSSLWKWLG